MLVGFRLLPILGLPTIPPRWLRPLPIALPSFCRALTKILLVSAPAPLMLPSTVIRLFTRPFRSSPTAGDTRRLASASLSASAIAPAESALRASAAVLRPVSCF